MKCPKCGHDIPRDNTRISGAIVEQFIEAIGGSSQMAADLAGYYEQVKDNPNRGGPMFRMMLEMLQNEDKARMHQNFAEEIAESHERAYVIEYVLGDRKLLETINTVAAKRGLIAGPVEDIDDALDVEFEKVP